MKITIRDYDLQYSGCLVKLRESIEATADVVRLAEVHDEEAGYVTRVRVLARYKAEGQLKESTAEHVLNIDAFDFEFLHLGVKNLPMSTFLVETTGRSSRYKKSTHPDSLMITDTIAPIRGVLGLRPLSELFVFNVLQALASTEYPTPQESLHYVSSGQKLSSAFSSEYHFSLSLTNSNIVLLRNNRVVGGWVRDQLRLSTWATRLREELQSYGLEVRA